MIKKCKVCGKEFETKSAALQFAKKEAIKTMKELTYIINFIDE